MDGYRLVALDVDDTLLRNDLSIAQRTLDAIGAAKREGVVFCIATGRMYRAVKNLIRMGIDGPSICFGGAQIVDSEGKLVFQQGIKGALFQEIVEFAHAEEAYLQAYDSHNFFFEQENQHSAFYEKLSGFPGVQTNFQHAEFDSPKLLIIDTQERVEQLRTLAKKRFGSRLNISTSRPTFLEIVAPDVSKGGALERLARSMGIERERVVAIGDGRIDKSMIEYAGLGIAMGNALPEVKAVADHITASNDEDGVALAIERFILNGAC
ncbi:MAG: Cof-type HAD-IIB family hydrolase [Christensenellales bacterium]|jgi:Cof subfamily protein (haloacid dehalogenase superfamily)